jgi:hypothetical protein
MKRRDFMAAIVGTLAGWVGWKVTKSKEEKIQEKGQLLETIEWISVKERLPELKERAKERSSDFVLVYAVGVVTIGYLEDSFKWIDNAGYSMWMPVSYWAELPNPEHVGVRTGKVSG